MRDLAGQWRLCAPAVLLLHSVFVSACAFDSPVATHALRPVVHVSEASFVIENRDPETEVFGGWVRPVGDVDGDGFDDVLVEGRSKPHRTYIRSYLFKGPIERDASTDDAVATFFEAFDDYHYRLTPIMPIGDIDGDGLADLAFGERVMETDSYEQPTISVFLGPVEGTLTPADADLTFVPERDWHSTGTATLAVGDFFGDEHIDAILLAQRTDGNVADDILDPAGEYPHEREVAWGWVGPLAPGTYTYDTADYVLQIEGPSGPRSPTTLAIGRCRPFEHTKDVLVVLQHSRSYDERGVSQLEGMITAYAWNEGSPRIRMVADHDGQVRDSSIWVSSASGRIEPVCADLDGDGYDEIVYGAIPPDDPRYTMPQGRGAYGVARLARDEVRVAVEGVVGGVPHDELGDSLAPVGDIDGDGLPEVAIAAPSSSTMGGFREGLASEVRLLASGAPLDLEIDTRIVSDVVFEAFAQAMGAGEVTGDGVPDVLVGATKLDETTGIAGRVFVFSGTTIRESAD